jgi:hypothetical protein
MESGLRTNKLGEYFRKNFMGKQKEEEDNTKKLMELLKMNED